MLRMNKFFLHKAGMLILSTSLNLLWFFFLLFFFSGSIRGTGTHIIYGNFSLFPFTTYNIFYPEL